MGRLDQPRSLTLLYRHSIELHNRRIRLDIRHSAAYNIQEIFYENRREEDKTVMLVQASDTFVAPDAGSGSSKTCAQMEVR